MTFKGEDIKKRSKEPRDEEISQRLARIEEKLDDLKTMMKALPKLLAGKKSED